ncbi:hypothetical protein F5144DRAFT_613352 [Chaetomium tenue]|uniref:Uncharacterized protein n=1 Tax=Chaetomium tenue TaxID=1854479 RepID=A0ACB7P569_9PEZI|nr:hypothetical protein F5144DRAFT_613352 [Chaetomium globosum]
MSCLQERRVWTHGSDFNGNPCLLNVCCNTWGQYGTTADICVISKSATCAPGTAAPGKSDCIRNYGRDVVKGPPPRKKIRIPYYESWNFNRGCINMWVDQIDTNSFTHVHSAFANVTAGDWKVEITDSDDPLNGMNYYLWDYNNKCTFPGCETGNCLRSYVNETETKDALSIITKAGAPSNKVVVGVASCGRSFKMDQAGFDSEGCKFTGSPRQSEGRKGRFNKHWKKEGSNVLVYNDTEWVAYMDYDVKKARERFHDSYNFAGTTDWAVNLQASYDGTGGDYYAENETWINDNYRISCTAAASPSSLEELQDLMSRLPAYCIEQYLVDIQVGILEGSLRKYKDLIDDDYDNKFRVYEKYVKTQIPEQIDTFMVSDKVDKYFKCQETICDYYDCAPPPPVDMPACPKFQFPLEMLDRTPIPNATFTLTDPAGFYRDLADTWGIDQAWVRFGKRHMRTNNGCQYAGKDVLKCQDRQDNWFRGYPLPDDAKIDIYNPKQILGDSFARVSGMLERFRIVRRFAQWDELMLPSDLVDATALPAFAAEEAIASMKRIVDTADDIVKAQREEFIFGFLTGLLFWIPFVGEAVGAVGLTTARTLLRLIGSVGDAGMAVHDVVDDPDNAFMSVFGYLMGAGVGRAGFRKAAISKRGMSGRELDGLGNVKVWSFWFECAGMGEGLAMMPPPLVSNWIGACEPTRKLWRQHANRKDGGPVVATL